MKSCPETSDVPTAPRIHRLLQAAGLGLLALAGGACQSSGPPMSGILGDRSVFERRSEDLLVHQVASEQDFQKYDRVLLEPVLIYLERDTDWASVSPSGQRRFKQMLREALKRELSATHTVVYDPGEAADDVVIVRAAITDVTTPEDGDKGSGLTSSTVEIELLDGATRKRLLAVISRSRVRENADTEEGRAEEAQVIVDGWARGLREWLDEVTGTAS